MQCLKTPHLSLCRVTRELALADLEDRPRFSRLLEAEIAPSWPPEFYDDAARRWMLHAASDRADSYAYYVLLARASQGPLLIGTAGFKGPPVGGSTEIGYSIVPEWQGRGLGTEIVAALIRHAFDGDGVGAVCAHTYEHLMPSRRVLEKNGFIQRGVPTEPGTIRYELTRAEWERASGGRFRLMT